MGAEVLDRYLGVDWGQAVDIETPNPLLEHLQETQQMPTPEQIGEALNNDVRFTQDNVFIYERDGLMRRGCLQKLEQLVETTRQRIGILMRERGATVLIIKQNPQTISTRIPSWTPVSDDPNVVVLNSLDISNPHRSRIDTPFIHPNIVPEIVFPRGNIGKIKIAANFLDANSLGNIHENLTTEQLAQLLIEAMTGNLFLHKSDMVHGDIKPDNILVKDDQGFLCDFDLSKKDNTELVHTEFGTLNYMALRYYEHRAEKYEKSRDVFSWGITILETIFGINLQQLFSNIRQGASKFNPEGKYEHLKVYLTNTQFGPNFSNTEKELMRFVIKMLDPDTNKRPSLAEVIKKLKDFKRKLKNNQS